MVPSSIILPQRDLSLAIIPLNSNWQIQGLFLTSLISGPQTGTICSISYLILGLFYLPVFHGGGSVGYILTHQFGYLLGFIPAGFICGLLAKRDPKTNLINYSIYTFLSLSIIHIMGIVYLILGNSFGNWKGNLLDLILINTVIPLPTQLLFCLSISLFSILLKRILILK